MMRKQKQKFLVSQTIGVHVNTGIPNIELNKTHALTCVLCSISYDTFQEWNTHLCQDLHFVLRPLSVILNSISLCERNVSPSFSFQLLTMLEKNSMMQIRLHGKQKEKSGLLNTCTVVN